jgi:hypothetical protein
MDFSKIKTELEESKVITGFKYIGISQTTTNNYIQKLKKIQADEGFEDILVYLNSFKNSNSRLAYQTAILGTAKHSPTFLKLITPEVVDSVREQQINLIKEENPLSVKQIKNDHEEENWVDWKDLLKLAKNKLKKDGINQDNILIAIYTLIPPSRLDFNNLLIVKNDFKVEDPKQNYLRIRTPTKMVIVLQDYKTSATHGINEIPVPVPLAKLISAFIKPETIYLFEKNGNKHLPFKSAETFSRYVKDVFKELTDKNISVDLLRHFFTTYFRKGDKTLKEKERVAKIMGHSVAIQEEYRRI